MTEAGVKTSLIPTGWQNEHQEYESVHTDPSIHPSGSLHLLISGVNKNIYKRNMYRVTVQQLELSDLPWGQSVCKCRPLPATPQRTADKAAPGSCSSLHTGSPPGQSARPPSGQGSTNVQKGSRRSSSNILCNTAFKVLRWNLLRC